MSLSMEASCNGCERYFIICYQKIYWPHTCVNPCLNRNHHQLDSQLVSTHINALIQAQFTLSTAAIQASVMEKWGYQISHKKALDGKHKAIR